MARTPARNLRFLATALFLWTSASLAAGAEIRLRGTIQCSGRLEVRRKGTWMSVCPDHFDLDAARVVCKELGCGAALMVYNVSSIANRTEMLRLTCQDGETPLAECWRPGWCRRGSDDAAVACSEPLLPQIALSAAGALLLLLLCTALCLVHRRRRAKHRSPTRFVSRVKNEYVSDNEEEEEDDYMNVEPVIYVKTLPAADGDDYKEVDSDEDHNYEETTPGEGFTWAGPARPCAVTGAQEEDSPDDEGDYENVSMPLDETEVETYWKEEDIYQNLCM